VPKPDIDPEAVSAILWRVFPGERSIPFERMRSGGSTQVYRIRRDTKIFYLRFGEDAEDTFAPEAWVHARLAELGVSVPRVVLIEDVAHEADRSIMITTEIPGAAMNTSGKGSGAEIRRDLEVYRAVGRDLAVISSIPVDGFGFVQRARPWNGILNARFPTFSAWFQSTVGDLTAIEAYFSGEELRLLEERIRFVASINEGCRGVLAHGDFDTSHIFVENGRYTGLIDFGEIRGADRRYDLANFILHAGEGRESPVVTTLVRGFGEIHPLFPNDLIEIESRAITLGVAWLRRIQGRSLSGYEAGIVRAIKNLLV